MAREINKLSARKVQTITKPGRHADGGGLYLVVEPSGSKRWAMLYRLGGRRREMGLGSVLSVPLTDARQLAAEHRRLIATGIDPLDARVAPPEARSTPPFSAIAVAFMDLRKSTWRNDIHKKQWRQTLEIHGAAIWKKPVDTIDTNDVLAVLRPLWGKHPETARRLRGRIERILDAAKVEGHRTGENPARWTGHLAMLLPKPPKLTRGNHAAMPYDAVPVFVAELQKRAASAARALEFLILTAARSGEVRRMPWSEVDIDGALWTIPGPRMKADRDHRVPLPRRAVEILREQMPDKSDAAALVFPGPRSGTASSDMVFTALLKRMKRGDVTTHGFRSSFKDWASDKTDFPSELSEAALAHLVGDETERAYRRGDALQKRRHLMDAWAAFLAGGLVDASALGVDDKNASKEE